MAMLPAMTFHPLLVGTPSTREQSHMRVRQIYAINSHICQQLGHRYLHLHNHGSEYAQLSKAGTHQHQLHHQMWPSENLVSGSLSFCKFAKSYLNIFVPRHFESVLDQPL